MYIYIYVCVRVCIYAWRVYDYIIFSMSEKKPVLIAKSDLSMPATAMIEQGWTIRMIIHKDM
jgi:hypothetical protein